MTEKKFKIPCKDYYESIEIRDRFKTDLIAKLESKGRAFSGVSVISMFSALDFTCELHVIVYD